MIGLPASPFSPSPITIDDDAKVTQPISLTLKYDLTVTADSLSGKAQMGMFASAKIAGNRL